jgi:RimJ/RimL family protein N-acetyltransferase
VALLPVPEPPLSDGVVVLRGWRESDVPQLVRACADPEVPRWTAVPAPYTEQDARDWVAGKGLDPEPPGDRYSFAVAPADRPEELSGSMGLFRIERGSGEIGYWTSPWARGQGVTTRAVRLLAAFGLNELGLKRVEMYIATGNAPSLRVAERAGFTREGVLRNFRDAKEIWRDHVAWSVIPGEA